MTTEYKVRKYIQTEGLLEKGDAVIVGVSGGADSVCLFLLLSKLAAEWGLRLAAVHVHHGIRGDEADADARFAEQLCRKQGVTFYREDFDVPTLAAEWKCGEEEAGRRVRHSAYRACAEKYFGGKAKIALGHHRDDVAETVLLSLVRGTGLAGLSGIRARTDLEIAGVKMSVVRPLLCLRRDEIEAYLNGLGQGWRTDATNEADDYARNRIRHTVMPMLTAANPKAVEHIARTAMIAGQSEDYLAKQAESVLADALDEAGGLEKSALSVLHPALASEVVRRWLAECGVGLKDIAYYHISEIVSLMEKPVGKQVELPNGFVVESGYETLRTCRKEDAGADSGREEGIAAKTAVCKIQKPSVGEAVSAEFGGYVFGFKACAMENEWEAAAKDENSFSILVNYDKIDEICLRFPKQGDQMTISRGGQHKKLTRILIDAKVPQELRAGQVLLTDGEEIVWVVGVRDCPDYFVTEETDRVLICHARRIGDE